MIDFISNKYTVSISGIVIVLILFIGAVLVVLASLYIINTVKLKRASEVKTGFLGKPLLQFSVIALSIGAIIGAVYMTNQGSNLIIEAGKQIEVKANYTIENDGNATRLLRMKPVPIVDSKEWAGDSSTKFDMFINIRPNDAAIINKQEVIDVVHTDKSMQNPSVIEAQLLPGKYKVRIIISFEGKSYQDEIDIQVL